MVGAREEVGGGTMGWQEKMAREISGTDLVHLLCRLYCASTMT